MTLLVTISSSKGKEAMLTYHSVSVTIWYQHLNSEYKHIFATPDRYYWSETAMWSRLECIFYPQVFTKPHADTAWMECPHTMQDSAIYFYPECFVKSWLRAFFLCAYSLSNGTLAPQLSHFKTLPAAFLSLEFYFLLKDFSYPDGNGQGLLDSLH